MNPSFLLRTLLYCVILVSIVATFKVLVAIYSIDSEMNGDEDGFDVIPKNDTASLDLIGKSEAVQTWLAKQQDEKKSLSEVESSLKVDEAAQLSQRRNPKFETVVDPEIERMQNQVHQFKFVQ
ncbi:unnamed protein product [Caenorhabditis brenneri]